jgi:hypothetical protein
VTLLLRRRWVSLVLRWGVPHNDAREPLWDQSRYTLQSDPFPRKAEEVSVRSRTIAVLGCALFTDG